MKVLVVKTSSMGDIIHTLPALTDAGKYLPEIHFDWVIEEAFAEIPTWHPLVNEVIPVALRRWRKRPLKTLFTSEWRNFYQRIKQQRYDLVIDAQGLLKSAFITFLSCGTRYGLDKHSAWEPLASIVYQRKMSVNPDQHAIQRMRQLFSRALNYSYSESTINYGLSFKKTNLIPQLDEIQNLNSYLIFVHGTSCMTKEWSEDNWVRLAELATKNNYTILLPWGNELEKQRAMRISTQNEKIKLLPRLNLTQLAQLTARATGVVSVDTGLGHLTAALSVPNVSLYLATDPIEIGTLGENQRHLTADHKSADKKNIKPEQVWDELMKVVA